ncbi:MAG: zinc ribbon domain-containing protein [Caldisericia bacterium]|jgi:RNA polymerase subunit RPABC4/transcription elongation factor Spt4|nr:zinc ribbon domain-containing protein [Caldisericia bacterium]
MDISTIQPYLNYLILLFVVALDIWIIEDSLRRFINKLFTPIIVILVTFVPYLIAYLLSGSPNYYLLLSGVLVWLIYLLIRPPYTLEEMQIIEGEQRLKDLQKKYYEYELNKSGRICPVCGLPVEPDYILCPNCYKKLKEKCVQCGRLIDSTWNICPYCGKKVVRKKEDEDINI